MKNELRNSKGITLIALVVTIIIMIILASVSIGLAINSDGIFNRSQEAKNKMEASTEFDRGQVNEFKASMNYSEEPVTITYNYNGAKNYFTTVPPDLTKNSFNGEQNEKIYIGYEINFADLSADDKIKLEFDYNYSNLTVDGQNSSWMGWQLYGTRNYWSVGINCDGFRPLGTGSAHYECIRTIQQYVVDEEKYVSQLRIDYYTGGSITLSNFKISKVNETTQQKQGGEKFGSLPTVTPEDNYVFLGWYTAPTGGVKITEDTRVPTTDTTYYAHWSK